MLERHRLFIAAIGNQISHVEAALRKSYDKEGRQPLRWVNLNEEECNDLATFLSGVSEVPQSAKTESSLCRSSAKSSIYENHERVVADMNPTSTCSLSNSSKMKGNKYVDAVDIDSSKVKDLEVKENFGRVDDALCKMDRSTKVRRASPPTVPDLQIVIVDENQERKQSITSLEVSRKGKSGPVFWKRGCGKFSQVRIAENCFNVLDLVVCLLVFYFLCDRKQKILLFFGCYLILCSYKQYPYYCVK